MVNPGTTPSGKAAKQIKDLAPGKPPQIPHPKSGTISKLKQRDAQ